MINLINVQEYSAVAWGHFLAQYKNSPRLECYVKSLFQPLNAIQQASIDLIEKRTLDTAQGAQIDGIGQIVGISRPIIADDVLYFGFKGQPNIAGFGQAPFIDLYNGVQRVKYLSDEEYKSLILFKIALNNGHGTLDEVAESIRVVFNASQVKIEEIGNAKIRISFDQNRTSPYVLKNARSFVPKLAGVGIEIEGTLNKLFFGFNGQLNVAGFGQAPFITAKDKIKTRT